MKLIGNITEWLKEFFEKSRHLDSEIFLAQCYMLICVASLLLALLPFMSGFSDTLFNIATYSFGLIILNTFIFAFGSAIFKRDIELDKEKEGREAILNRYRLGYDNERFIEQLQEKLKREKEDDEKSNKEIAKMVREFSEKSK